MASKKHYEVTVQTIDADPVCPMVNATLRSRMNGGMGPRTILVASRAGRTIEEARERAITAALAGHGIKMEGFKATRTWREYAYGDGSQEVIAEVPVTISIGSDDLFPGKAV